MPLASRVTLSSTLSGNRRPDIPAILGSVIARRPLTELYLLLRNDEYTSQSTYLRAQVQAPTKTMVTLESPRRR